MSSLATLAALIKYVSAAHCDATYTLVNSYVVTTSGVPNIPQTCGWLWDNLEEFPGCEALSDVYCGGTNGNLKWTLTASWACDAPKIESSWWDSTGNKYGAIDCAS
ncbi:uncharacterized protein Z518_08405 [Rhinocladiella mackenziei CBS 650.93]|uniref:Uncharacterized protein n=1 Tax=Rhinocladiella mackenziei CBS 650.93 TaxID=1442369 RepID=A0A0D2I9G5_9EURO|nr:uncharacterized protein Z518_08405 [Rhinocladiella mackenziei CBS 650.93]KIX02464.1 hypothetical protein Z518_08405 [Rhinocladiella mackenziei CBS 650.93]